jgi:hypothetical protein
MIEFAHVEIYAKMDGIQNTISDGEIPADSRNMDKLPQSHESTRDCENLSIFLLSVCALVPLWLMTSFWFRPSIIAAEKLLLKNVAESNENSYIKRS